MKRVHGMLLLPLLLCPTSTVEGASRSEAAQDIERLLDEYARLGSLSGAVLVADREGVLLEKAYGLANREWEIPNAVDTRFRVGSLTKQFTAALIMKLVDEGRLDLEARLSDVLPWYRQDTGAEVTIRQLLSHTSGIDRSGVPRMIQEQGRTGMPLRDAVAVYCSGDLEWEPGTRFAYNNAGYLILGAVVEELYGIPYAQALRGTFLDPLGMMDTGLDDSRRILPRRADGYERTPEGLRKAEYVTATLAASAGGVYSTVGDLYLWDRALYADDLLSAVARSQMFTPGLGSYGFGWFIVDMPVGPGGENRAVIRHPGQGDGFYSILWRIPDEEIAIAIIHNLGRTDITGIASSILDVLYGRTARVGIGEVLRDAIDREGVDAARESYFRLRQEAVDRYDFDEQQLNELGYTLFRRGSVAEGMAVLMLNAEAFPGSANAQDSLGEALERTGDLEGAIARYRRALELDPNFTHAAQRLQELQSRQEEHGSR